MSTIDDRHAAAGHEPVNIPAQEPRSDPPQFVPRPARWAVPEAPEKAPVALEAPDCGPTMPEAVATNTEARSEAAAPTEPGPAEIRRARELADLERQPMTRSKCLDAARAAVIGDREYSHGEPEDVFPMIAAMWSAYLGVPVADYDVPAMMVLLKVARFSQNPQHEDGPVDMAGYAACAAELAPGKKPPSGLRLCAR